MHFINEQNSQELQISHSLRICLFTEGTVVPWVPGSCSCIHTHNQRNLYRLYPNSWRSDASCRRAAHRGCRALAPVFTHTISAIFTVGIRIPGGQTLPAAGLPIVCAVRLLLHSHTETAFSHTESAQSLPLASEFLAARRFLPTGCTS